MNDNVLYLEEEMAEAENIVSTRNEIRNFFATINRVLSTEYDQTNIEAVKGRLFDLANILPSTTSASAMAKKLFHKRKLRITESLLADMEYKKLGTNMIKDLAKDKCHEEIELLDYADNIHKTVLEQIGVLRGIVSLYKEELGSRVAYATT